MRYSAKLCVHTCMQHAKLMGHADLSLRCLSLLRLQMSATIAGLNACGLLIRARQLTAQPQQELQTFRVGHWHAAGVPISVKGTRAPIKAYTDLKAEIDDCQGGFCPAMEAAFGQLNVAFKRLVAPNALNPDGTVIANTKPVLPWWDMMR